MPNEHLLYKYNLTQFLDVVRAVRYEDCLNPDMDPVIFAVSASAFSAFACVQINLQ